MLFSELNRQNSFSYPPRSCISHKCCS